MQSKLNRNDLIHPELSYLIIGSAYEVYNSIGSGHLEKIYQRALAVAFEKNGLKFQEQIRRDIIFAGKIVGSGKLDFLVEKKIVVEIKRANYFNPADFEQVLQYLKMNNLELGILIRFTTTKVLFKRVLNVADKNEISMVEEDAAEYMVSRKKANGKSNY